MTDAERRSKAAERSKRHYRANRDKKIAYARQYRADNAEKVAASQRKTLYGITPEQFAALVEKQQNACAICGSKAPGGRGEFHVDHCHSSGRVRGLLCHHCNVGLGHFKDSPELLTAATQYLET